MGDTNNKKTFFIESTNNAPFTPPVNVDSDYKDIFLKFNYKTSEYTETEGKYSFIIYFSNGFPGGDITFKNLSTGEIIEFKSYNNNSGVFSYPLDDIKVTFTYYINGQSYTISKTFLFKNALNFTNQMFRTNFLEKNLKPIIYNNYLKIAYNKNVSDFDAHIYYNDDMEHDLNVGCYSYQDLDINSFNPKTKDFTVFKMKYNDVRLVALGNSKCLSRLWKINVKNGTVKNPKIYYDLFFFYKKLREDFKNKNINPYPFRIHYTNPIVQYNSLIVDYYD
jgi:hypothetical protein